MPGNPADSAPLGRLRAAKDRGPGAMLRALARAKDHIAAEIARAAKEGRATGAGPRALYNEIAATYDGLSASIDKSLRGAVFDAARDGAARAGEDAAGELVRFDRARLERYWEYVRPANGKSLAAVFTDRMAQEDIDALRQALVSVERQAAIEGWTANERQKALRDAWSGVAGDERAFVDRSGREWEDAQYLQMLARTTEQRVYNDAYADRLAESGYKFARIVSMGEPDCKVCRAWQGRIVSLKAEDDRYPTVEEARAAGVWHPNCLCTLEYIDEDLDGADIRRQGDAGKPGDMEDADEVQAQTDEFDVGRKMDEGMDEAGARLEVTRDRLRDAIRGGALPEDAAAAVSGLSDADLEAISESGVPRVRLAKKGEEPGWDRRGGTGVVVVDRDDPGGSLLDVIASDDTHKALRATAEFLDGLGQEEADVIRRYSRKESGESGTWNSALRGGGRLDAKAAADVALLDNVLAKAPKYEGTVFRGVGGSFAKDLAQYKAGDVFTEDGFMSTSVSRDKAKVFAANTAGESGFKVIMKIRSKNGVCITRAAVHRDELEILYRKGSKFRVASVRRLGDNSFQLEMEEI